MTPQLHRACRGAVHIITAGGQVIAAGRAGLFVLEELGYPRLLLRLLARPPLVWFIEAVYRLVARHRRFFGRFLFTGQN